MFQICKMNLWTLFNSKKNVSLDEYEKNLDFDQTEQDVYFVFFNYGDEKKY